MIETILFHPLTLAIIKLAFLISCVMACVAYSTLAERRIAAFIQMRLGPNRVGPFGLFQPVADGLKNFFKEEIIPSAANKIMFILAPAMIMVPALMTFAVIPFGGTIKIGEKIIPLEMADMNVGILFVLAMAGMGVYGIVIGGWASNNKYSLLGGLRAAAQIVSYELPMGLSLVAVFMVTGTFNLRGIVDFLAPNWWAYFILLFPTMVIFIVTAFAETNRLPFDMPECESELVGGYHTEYSSMKFALFFMAEYANMITSSCLMVLLFFGGWNLPFISKWLSGFQTDSWIVAIIVGLIPAAIFAAKVVALIFTFIWVRWTIPRFRYDQIMRLGWKYLMPLALGNIFFVGIALIVYHLWRAQNG